MGKGMCVPCTILTLEISHEKDFCKWKREEKKRAQHSIVIVTLVDAGWPRGSQKILGSATDPPSLPSSHFLY